MSLFFICNNTNVRYNFYFPKLKKPKRVLVTPLNWGLGHATRCIPIINELLLNGFEVVLASDGRSLDLLKKEFPKLKAIELPAYDIRYSTDNMLFNIAFQIPKIIAAIWKEHHFIKKIIKREQLDIIISDNRYGCKSGLTKNIFITHQLNIIIPWKPLEWLVNKFNHFLIAGFDECWVPDFYGKERLAGRLSDNIKLKKVKYLGILSRMQKKATPRKYEIITILSGPEPQRTKLEEIITKELKSIDKKSLIVQGRTDLERRFELNENIEVVAYLNTAALNEAILSSDLVICRSGYSSIMDLVTLEKEAILIPTPGQTEQEYLARRLKKQGRFSFQDQATFSLKRGIEELKSYGISEAQADKTATLKSIILTLKN